MINSVEFDLQAFEATKKEAEKAFRQLGEAPAQEGVPADDPRMSETADWAAKLAQGLLNLASKHGYVGFVARGLCEEDGKSICSLSSIDQHTHWVHGLYRYAHSPMARPAILAEWRQRIAEVAARMERTVTPETAYNFGLCDGRPDPRGICRMWWPNETNSTGSCRLPSIYAACVTRNKREVRGWTGRTPTHVLLQMNASLEVMLGCEKDPVRRANILEGLRQSAAEADYRAKTMWKDPKRKWYGMVPDAELALAQLMADNAPYDATELQIFTQAMTAGDPNDWWSLKTTHMFAAYWRTRHAAAPRDGADRLRPPAGAVVPRRAVGVRRHERLPARRRHALVPVARPAAHGTPGRGELPDRLPDRDRRALSGARRGGARGRPHDVRAAV